MRSPFSFRTGDGQPRLTAAMAAGLDQQALHRSTQATEALWRAVPLGEPWTENNHARTARTAR